MVWYEIVVTLLGSLGGLAGVAAFIKSFWMLRPDKEAKEINNQHAEIENLKAFIDIANQNYDRLSKQFDKMEQEKNALEIATMQAYRCQFPPELNDCPVVKILKATQGCQGCIKEEEKE